MSNSEQSDDKTWHETSRPLPVVAFAITYFIVGLTVALEMSGGLPEATASGAFVVLAAYANPLTLIIAGISFWITNIYLENTRGGSIAA